MSEQIQPTPQPQPAPVRQVIPADPTNIPTSFLNLPVHVRLNQNTYGGKEWEMYVELDGIPWIFARRKYGGLADDLQEKATPGFKEQKARRYAAEWGRARTEPGPGHEYL